MSETNVKIRVDVEGHGDVSQPFKKITKSAKETDESLKGLSQSAGRFKEHVEGLKSGLMGLAVSSNALPPSLAKVADGLTDSCAARLSSSRHGPIETSEFRHMVA